MSIAIIQDKLPSYECKNILEQENALKEIAQEIALMSLSRSGFFNIASFQGGTCLRILYNLERFSEDLDFALDVPNKDFTWDKFIVSMREEFSTYGFNLEIKQPARIDNPVKMAFLKTTSVGGVLVIKDKRTNQPQINIKLEIDTNPPSGTASELKFLDFPLPYSVKVCDMPSLFAGKCHALLCRGYLKGRDWYDFVWYISRHTQLNFSLLTAAVMQNSPWLGQNIRVTKQWLLDELQRKIIAINWSEAKQDVVRFLRPQQLASIELWSQDFFLSRLDKLSMYLLDDTK